MTQTAQAVLPSHLHIPDGVRGNYGDEVADFADLMGRPLDPAQRCAVDARTSYTHGGRWLALEGCFKLPRRNGKTGGIMTPIALTDLFLWPADRIAWTAHLFKTSREAFADHKLLIDGSDELRRRVKKITEANGEESIELLSGARMDYLARSKGGGRGLGGKRVVIDEALFFTEEQGGALLPILATADDPQIDYGSSACKTESDQLRALTRRGRSGVDASLVYVEWCAPGGFLNPGCAEQECTHAVGTASCTLDDVEALRSANPAMVFNRITVEFLQAMRRSLTPREYAREFLGWDEAGADIAERPVAPDDWSGTRISLEERRKAELTSPRCFVLDVSPGMRSGAIGAGGMLDGKPHADLADGQPGTDWIKARLLELRARVPDAHFAYDATGAAIALVPALSAAGVDLEPLTGKDMQAGAALMQKLSLERGWTHTQDVVLDASFDAAAKRYIGDSGWDWGRRKTSGDIAPIRSVTGALWLLEKHRDEANPDQLDSFW